MTLASTLKRPRWGMPMTISLHAELAAAFDDLLERGHHRLAAVETEALGAGIFDVEEALEDLGLDQLLQDRLPPALGEASPRGLRCGPGSRSLCSGSEMCMYSTPIVPQ